MHLLVKGPPWAPKADADAKDAFGRTAAHLAAGLGVGKAQHRVLKELLQQNASHAARDAHGLTPLAVAVRCRQTRAAEVRLSFGLMWKLLPSG